MLSPETRHLLTDAISQDAAAFEAVMDAYRRKDLDETARRAAVEKATIEAARVPLDVAQLSLETAELAAKIARAGNISAATDAAAGALMAQAAVQAAALNVRVNASGLNDRVLANTLREQIDALEERVAAITSAAVAAAAERGGY